MLWITLTETNLYEAKAAQFILAVQQSCLAAGQADPVPNLIAATAEELRGAVGFSGKYQVSATLGSIPPNLKDLAVQKIVRVCKSRLEQQFSSADMADESTYQRRLSAIMAGNWPIDVPDDPLGTSPSNPSGRVSFIAPPARQFTGCDLQGL